MEPAKTDRQRSAERTQEVRAIDILEETPIERDLSVDVDLGSLAHRGASSLSPIAVSIAPARRHPAESTYKIDLPQPPRRRLGAVVAGAMGLSVCILLLATIRARTAEPAVAPSSVAAIATAATNRAPAVAHGWLPTVPVPETAPTSGTVTSHGGALFIDGTRMSAKSAVVACGHHQLRVGRGKGHDADVPCGGTLIVDRSGKMTVRPEPAGGPVRGR